MNNSNDARYPMPDPGCIILDERFKNPEFSILNPASPFTLIELLIVMAVIAILIAIAIPSFRGMQDEARKTTRKRNGTSAVEGRPNRRERETRIRREHEGNTKRIRREYDSNTRASRAHPACTWLVVLRRRRGAESFAEVRTWGWATLLVEPGR